jgi:hypothetical protein
MTGCGSFRKKFQRKKKEEKSKPYFYREKEYDIKPSITLYTKHYQYWKSWHREILENLGQNTKKDQRCVEEMIGNLMDMKSMLDDEPGDKLQAHIDKLWDVQTDMRKNMLMSTTEETRIRRTLEKEFTLIKRDFSYNKVRAQIRPDFRDEDIQIEGESGGETVSDKPGPQEQK